MNGFERQKEQKKQSIIKVAMELFKLYGFKKASITDIAQKASVSQVTIYNHFGSKEGLAREVVKTILMQILEMSQEILKQDMPFPDKLEAMIFNKVNIAVDYHGELMKIAAQSDPELRQWIETLWQEKIQQIMHELIEDGKKQGYIDSSLSDKMITLYMDILRNGVFANPAVFDKLEADAKEYKALNYLFMYGLAGKGR